MNTHNISLLSWAASDQSTGGTARAASSSAASSGATFSLDERTREFVPPAAARAEFSQRENYYHAGGTRQALASICKE